MSCTNMAASSLLLLLLTVWTVGSAANSEQVESRPIDGHQFVEGQTFRFVCRAVGSQDFAVRLHCPLSEYAPVAMRSIVCYENCGRPLCNQPVLNDCSETVPELLDSGCNQYVRQLSDGTQEVTIEYAFRAATVRNNGVYTCQYKNMRSSVHIGVSATTTTSTTTTTTASTSSTTTSTTTATTATTTRPSTTMTSKARTTTTHQRPAAKATAVAVVTATTSPASGLVHPAGKGNTGSPGDSNPRSGEVEEGESSTEGSGGEVPLKSGGWFYSSMVGNLIGVDMVLIVLLAALAVVLISGFLFIRCQVSARQKNTSGSTPATPEAKRPLQACCSTLLCLGDAGGGGGRNGEAKSASNGHARLPRAERPQLQAFAGSDTASGQVYSEANLDSSYYSQGESDRLTTAAAGGPTDEYYRLQTNFEEANPRLMVGGSQRGPRAGGGGGGAGVGASGFFNRDAPDRHSFHNVRTSRQRPAIPAELLVRAAPAGAEPSGEEIREQVEQQRREIEHLRKQLRDSQKQLSRLANSQQDLHRSVQCAGASAATTPDELPTSGDDYELLSKAATPTGELPSFAGSSTAAPPAPVIDNAGLRGSADLLLSIDEPIEEEEAEAEADSDHFEYPTVRSKRRSSIGEAYGSGRLCPA